MTESIIIESYDRLQEQYSNDWERLRQNYPVLVNKCFALGWIKRQYSLDGNPVIFIHKEAGQVTAIALFHIYELDMDREVVYGEDGNRFYKRLPYSLVKYKIARLIGNILGKVGDRSKLIHPIVKVLLEKYRVDCISLFFLREGFTEIREVLSGLQPPLKYIAHKTSDLFAGEIGNSGYDSMRLTLPRSYEELLLPFSHRKKHHYNIKKLDWAYRNANKQYNITFQVLKPGEDNRLIIARVSRDILSIESTCWQKQENQNYLSKYGIEDLTDKMSYLEQSGKLLLPVMYADNVPVSYILGIKEGKLISEIFTAYNREYRNISPGKLVMFKFIEACIDMNLAEIEFSGTLHHYKTSLVDKRESSYEIVIFNTTQAGKLLYRIKKMFKKAHI